MWTRWYDFDRSFSALDEFQRRMDRMFGEFQRESPRFPTFPRANLYDTDTAYVIQAEMPGMSEKDVDLSIHQDEVCIEGERTLAPPTGYSVHRQERAPYKFSRTFTLPEPVDVDAATASLRDGILVVVAPKTAQAKARTIEIKAN